jgi:hypothetical protein
MNLVTQFGYVKIINLNEFIENIPIENVLGELGYIRSMSVGFSFEASEDPKVSDFLRVSPEPKNFSNIQSLKISVEEDIRKNIQRKGDVEHVDNILLDFCENYGEPKYLVKLPNNLLMPANLGDFRIRTFNNEYAFCWFHENRFFCYKFDLDKYLKEIGANTP